MGGGSDSMQIELAEEEMQEVRRISEMYGISVAGLCDRLEVLLWGDGLLEFRMQSQATGELLPWMEQLDDLSKAINRRLRKSNSST